MVIFGGRIKIFSSGLGSCDGVCVTDSSKCAEGTAPMPTKNCDSNADGTPEIKGDAVCCKAVS